MSHGLKLSGVLIGRTFLGLAAVLALGFVVLALAAALGLVACTVSTKLFMPSALTILGLR